MYFPINVDINNRHCTVIGGGRVAQRKVKGLLSCEGRVTVISPEVTSELADLAARSRIKWLARGYQQGDLADSFMVIAATDNQEVQEAVFKEAQEDNILLNVADVPKWCNFILPATIRRGDLTVAISTAGKSPALASQTRKRLEDHFGHEYELALQLMGRLRPVILARQQGHQQNKKTFAALLHPELLDWLAAGDWVQVRDHLNSLLGEDEHVEEVLTTLQQQTG